MFARPLTGTVSPAVVSLVTFHAPAHAAEHLIHGWEAIKSAIKVSYAGDYDTEKKHIAYAHSRLACAKSEPCARGVKPRDRAAYEAECESLTAALADYS